jgi:hypothetical protein
MLTGVAEVLLSPHAVPVAGLGTAGRGPTAPFTSGGRVTLAGQVFLDLVEALTFLGTDVFEVARDVTAVFEAALLARLGEILELLVLRAVDLHDLVALRSDLVRDHFLELLEGLVLFLVRLAGILADLVEVVPVAVLATEFAMQVIEEGDLLPVPLFEEPADVIELVVVAPGADPSIVARVVVTTPIATLGLVSTPVPAAHRLLLGDFHDLLRIVAPPNRPAHNIARALEATILCLLAQERLPVRLVPHVRRAVRVARSRDVVTILVAAEVAVPFGRSLDMIVLLSAVAARIVSAWHRCNVPEVSPNWGTRHILTPLGLGQENYLAKPVPNLT